MSVRSPLHDSSPTTPFPATQTATCVRRPQFRVARSRDGGKNWTLLTRGLPQKNVHTLVLRESMTSDHLDPAGVYVGTSSGQVFYTRDAGNNWQVLADNLPPVMSVSVAKA